MIIKLKQTKVYIEETCIILFFLCMFSKYVWKFFENYYICFLFILFHECSHLFFASLFGNSVNRINIRLAGANIEIKKDNNAAAKWILIYLAGPVANIILAAIFKNIKLVFEINAALACINILPIFPLDGYNIFKIVLSCLVKKKNLINACKIISNGMLLMLAVTSIYLICRYNNFSLAIMSMYMLMLGVLKTDKT